VPPRPNCSNKQCLTWHLLQHLTWQLLRSQTSFPYMCFLFQVSFSFPGSFSLTRGSSLSNCKAANLSVFTKNPVGVSHQYSLGIRAVACFTVLIRNFFAAVVEVRIWFFWEEAAACISVRSLSAGGWNEFPSFGLGGDLKESLGFRNGSND
jgi:hypothetical protein